MVEVVYFWVTGQTVVEVAMVSVVTEPVGQLVT
jgi:hypothetical protein